MSSRKKKKKVNRKPKSNAVTSKRRPRPSTRSTGAAARRGRQPGGRPTGRSAVSPRPVREVVDPEPEVEEPEPGPLQLEPPWPDVEDPANEQAEAGAGSRLTPVLTVAPPPPPATARPPWTLLSSQRWSSVHPISVLAVVVAIAVVLLVAWRIPRSGDYPATHPRHGFAPPVRLAGDRAVVHSRVLSSLELRVTHWIHTTPWIFTARLRLPDVAGLSPGSLSVRHLVVASNGVRLAAGNGLKDARTMTIPLPPTHSLYVSYVLSGAVQQDRGSAGRALARLTSLELTTDALKIPTTHAITGAQVLALACSHPTAGSVPQPCGVERNGRWSVALDRNDAQERVMAQMDLS